jgi:ABC-2 type transport system permease protein
MSAPPAIAPPRGVKPIRGPSALGGDAKRFWTLTWTLAVLEFRLKFFGSILGYLWQLMRPLMLFTVLYIVFSQGVEIRWSWLELIPLVALLCALCTGVATAVSALYVRYRDVQPIWDVMLPISFYGTPILYPLESVPNPTVRELLMLNPLAVVVQQTRHALIDPTAPSAADAIGGAPRLLLPLGIVALVCWFGYWTFNRAAPRIAEEM